MISKLSQFWSLTAFEKKILIQALVLLPLIKLGIHVWSYKRVLAALERTSNSANAPEDEQKIISGTVHMVKTAAQRRLVGATCLTRSMALWWLLRRQGVPSEIRFGVRRGDNGIQAHAWVEKGGVVLNDRADIRTVYATFESDLAVRKLNWQ